MASRRDFLKTGGIAFSSGIITGCVSQSSTRENATFSFCLNTSTIRGQNPGLKGYIDIASEAGYDGVELWVRDVKEYIENGNSANELRNYIENAGLRVENAIGFAPWLADGEEGKEKGFTQMQEEMELMASIGCLRIAASPAGMDPEKPLDFFEAGARYQELINIGKKIGIMPLLEFWGASPTLFHLGQALMIATAANHPEVKILPDVYHLFRGGSGFEGLKMLSGNVIEVFHMNDYVDTIPRQEQKDSDRVYPGDGVAPLKSILSDLFYSGGKKILSIELFNENYYSNDAREVAKTALQRMKQLVASIT